MYKQVKIQTPTVPNFILTDDLKQPIPIEDFTEDELRVIGNDYTLELIKKARNRRVTQEYKDYTPVHHTTADRPLNTERE